MKICKVKITKKMSGNVCRNIYPPKIDQVNVISYDEEPLEQGENIGYCIGVVADDFIFTGDIIEISKQEADIFINARGEKFKDTKDNKKYKSAKKRDLKDLGIV